MDAMTQTGATPSCTPVRASLRRHGTGVRLLDDADRTLQASVHAISRLQFMQQLGPSVVDTLRALGITMVLELDATDDTFACALLDPTITMVPVASMWAAVAVVATCSVARACVATYLNNKTPHEIATLISDVHRLGPMLTTLVVFTHDTEMDLGRCLPAHCHDESCRPWFASEPLGGTVHGITAIVIPPVADNLATKVFPYCPFRKSTHSDGGSSGMCSPTASPAWVAMDAMEIQI
jgi:hypothetical protein